MLGLQVAVIGATGRTGSLIVLNSIERGYTVVALVRNADKLKAKLGRSLSYEETKLLTIVIGSPLSSGDVEKAVKGADVVFETVGGCKVCLYNIYPNGLAVADLPYLQIKLAG